MQRSIPLRPRALTAAACALLLSLVAHAQTAAPASTPAAPQPSASQPMSAGEAKAIREFNLLDTNGDGKLSRQEVALIPQLAAAFDEADTNHDHFVTLDEVRAFATQYRAERDRARAAARSAEASAPAAAPTP